MAKAIYKVTLSEKWKSMRSGSVYWILGAYDVYTDRGAEHAIKKAKKNAVGTEVKDEDGYISVCQRVELRDVNRVAEADF